MAGSLESRKTNKKTHWSEEHKTGRIKSGRWKVLIARERQLLHSLKSLSFKKIASLDCRLILAHY